MSTHHGPIVKYTCSNDCDQFGCPGHTIQYHFSRTSDTISVDVDGKQRHCFDENEWDAMLRSAELPRKARLQRVEEALRDLLAVCEPPVNASDHARERYQYATSRAESALREGEKGAI